MTEKTDSRIQKSKRAGCSKVQGATAHEIRAFAEKIARIVNEKTGILPEYEVSLVGDWR